MEAVYSIVLTNTLFEYGHLKRWLAYYVLEDVKIWMNRSKLLFILYYIKPLKNRLLGVVTMLLIGLMAFLQLARTIWILEEAHLQCTVCLRSIFFWFCSWRGSGHGESLCSWYHKLFLWNRTSWTESDSILHRVSLAWYRWMALLW